MTRRLLVAAAMAGGLLLAPLAPQPAAAVPPVTKIDTAKADGLTLVRRGGRHGGGRHGGRHGGGHRSFGHGGGHRSFRGGGGHRSFRGGGRRSHGGFRRHRQHRHRRSRYYLPYVPYYYGDYSYYYDDCAWLRRKALRTDSRYWWRRYDACLDDY